MTEMSVAADADVLAAAARTGAALEAPPTSAVHGGPIAPATQDPTTDGDAAGVMIMTVDTEALPAIITGSPMANLPAAARPPHPGPGPGPKEGGPSPGALWRTSTLPPALRNRRVDAPVHLPTQDQCLGLAHAPGPGLAESQGDTEALLHGLVCNYLCVQREYGS